MVVQTELMHVDSCVQYKASASTGMNKHLQVHAAAATSLPAVLDGPGDVGELVPGMSGRVEGKNRWNCI